MSNSSPWFKSHPFKPFFLGVQIEASSPVKAEVANITKHTVDCLPVENITAFSIASCLICHLTKKNTDISQMLENSTLQFGFVVGGDLLLSLCTSY